MLCDTTSLRIPHRTSSHPFEDKKNRILELYAIADGLVEAGEDDPTVVICIDEFGPLNLQPHPGKQWATKAAGKGDVEAPRRRRMRATYTRPHGVRHMMGAYDLATDRLYGHVVTTKNRTAFIRFLRYVRKLHPPDVRIGIVLDNFSPHLSTRKDQRVGEWAAANNVELAYTPTYSSWLNRIEAQFQARGCSGGSPGVGGCWSVAAMVSSRWWVSRHWASLVRWSS